VKTTIPIHSLTDIITNSSTTIFTYSNCSPNACREMIDEIFTVLGVDKKCDDVFTLTVMLRNDEYYYEYWNGNEDDEDEPKEGALSNDKIDAIIKDVVTGKVDKPNWMIEAEEKEGWSGYSPSTELYITPKLPEYEKLAKLISNFLYSTGHEGTRDG
jgi:hypothetical protein